VALPILHPTFSHPAVGASYTDPVYRLLTDIHTLLTMSGTRDAPVPPLRDAAILLRDNQIEWVGTMSALEPELRARNLSDPTASHAADLERISLRDHIVLPGLINTHHHLYQTLTRCVAQDAGLFDWLRTLYPIWLGLTPDAIYTSALTGMAELLLSGCTTTADHLYLYPNGCRLDDTVEAARAIGMRFHPTRGSMSLGESKGGLPPDRAVEDENFILEDSVRVLETFHDPSRLSMLRVALAPCSPFSVTPDLMIESAGIARTYGVRLHTHLAETRDEDQFCLERFGMRPLEYMESLGWLDSDVWYAHGVHFSSADLHKMGRCGCGVAHCPSSNMRLASGIAPVRRMWERGVRVGLGVDGSASNDGGAMLLEARMALLLARVMDESFAALERPEVGARQALSAYEALWLATRGGAEVLGRDDIGRLAPGYAADLIALNLNRLEYAGAQHDPLAALVFCAPKGVDFSLVNGRVVVENGQLVTLELGPLLERHNRLSAHLINNPSA